MQHHPTVFYQVLGRVGVESEADGTAASWAEGIRYCSGHALGAQPWPHIRGRLRISISNAIRSRNVDTGAEALSFLSSFWSFPPPFHAILRLKLLHPDWKVRIVERLPAVGLESSNECLT